MSFAYGKASAWCGLLCSACNTRITGILGQHKKALILAHNIIIYVPVYSDMGFDILIWQGARVGMYFSSSSVQAVAKSAPSRW